MHTLTDRIHLEEDETVLATVRKHWFILTVALMPPLLALLAPLLAYVFFGSHPLTRVILAALPEQGVVLTAAAAVWFLICWTMLFFAWTDHYLDLWVITNRRVIAIDQRGLFRRSVASFRYERLQDLNVEINGFIATMLDFGDLQVQTAGHADEFRIRGVPDPRELKARISAAADARLTREVT